MKIIIECDECSQRVDLSTAEVNQRGEVWCPHCGKIAGKTKPKGL